MAERPARKAADIARKKGHKASNARPGNANGAKGPRIGRQDKDTMPLPQPQADAKPRQRPRRQKTGGRDFLPGANSHGGEVFRRGEDMIPRGNFTLFAKCVYHDARGVLYRRFCRILQTGSNREVIALAELLGNRIEGLPTKKVERTETRHSVFVFTTKDGQEVPALEPLKVGAGATAAAATADDRMVLGGEEGLVPV